MKKDDAVYLRHILECIRRIEEDTRGDYDGFMASHTHQDAVLRNLQTLAESTQRLAENAKAQYPAVPWRSIAAFRYILVHNYLGVDLYRIWNIVQDDIPQLKAAIKRMLDDMGNEH
jgi:uncharacterized protein with HEPN domain